MLGTTSFAYRFQLEDRASAPSIGGIIRQTAEAGLEALQICENARPLELPVAEWRELAALGGDLGVELSLGGKTMDIATFTAYHERALALGSRVIRVVLESEAGVPATRKSALAFFDAIVPLLQAHGTRIAVENYFGIACRDLASWCSQYPVEQIGYCVDSANSLRKLEPLEQVLELLTPRALCWHVKDWKLTGTDTGFSVSGANLGTGDLPLVPLIRHIHAQAPAAPVYLENWPPRTGNREVDVATDRAMLAAAVRGWNQGLASASGSA